jgi:protease-4
MLHTADKALDKLSVRVGGVATTWLVGAYDPRRPLDPRMAALVQGAIAHIYEDFTAKAAQARKTTPAQIDAVGQGRVWTGSQARERGLVDATGNFMDALKSAVTRAKLEADAPVRYIEAEPGRLAWLFDLLGGGAAAQWLAQQLQGPALPLAVMRDVQRELGWLAELSQGQRPFAAATHCLCESP